ncbi:MBL fold metallo-hydrolase [Rhizobium sp. Root483D2]|uniref:MBL fold metallo-hydrolase n=1 Tax=Rhizobium sp. Root483D2 TaxID=1736545 RepID=UPI0007149356|nr:MBL fold metallo-hydrolase [Rhizobium sp. Root483D2]KQY42482.1 MBL fold metallo-hydrolase [Rhizobium sp. Root483D2]
MTDKLVEIPLDRSLSKTLAQPVAPGNTRLHWLCQAGFIIETNTFRMVIDPYLSDTLAEKYRGTARPHERMMPAPIAPADLAPVDLVLCTHHHTDHMDPGTLIPLMAANPHALLVAPRASLSTVRERSGLPDGRLCLMNAGETLTIDSITVTATRAAHEALETDDAGNHRFLGYLIDTGSVRIWHSGDSIPFEGLAADIAALKPDLALLPVNGRKAELSNNGVPGNFTLDEAIGVATKVGCTAMVAHHYGLFAFNTEDPDRIDAASAHTASLRVVRARAAIALEWRNG